MSLKNGTHSALCLSATTQSSRADLVPSIDKFPSSVAFEAINAALNSSEADKKDAIKQGNAVFAFTLKNKAGETDSWHIDLKQSGSVGKGLGTKPTGRRLLAQVNCSALTFVLHSYSFAVRRGLWQAGRWSGQRTTAIHVRETQDQG